MIRYDIADGLLSSTVYEVLQDRTGYLWFGTDYGVCRFDGYDFTAYSLENGLADESTVHIYEDPKGRIWFLSYPGTLSYIDHGKIIQYAYNDKLRLLNKHAFIDKILIDSLDRLWFAPKWGGEYLIDSLGNITIEDSFNIKINAKYYYLHFEDLGTDYKIGLVDPPFNGISANPEIYRQRKNYFLRLNAQTIINFRNYLKLSDDDYLISVSNLLFHIQGGKIVQKKVYKNEIAELYLDKDKNIWVSVLYEGMEQYPLMNLQAEPIRYFQGMVVGGMLQDNENSYWFTTTGNGVYSVPSFQFKVYSLPGRDIDYQVVSMAATHNQLFFSTFDKRLYQYTEGSMGSFKIQSFLPDRIPTASYDLLVSSDSSLWIVTSKGLRYDFRGNPLPVDTLEDGFALYEDKHKNIWVGGFRIARYTKNAISFHSPLSYYRRIYSMCEDNDGQIWLGTINGLYYIKNNAIKPYDKYSQYFSNRITAMSKNKDFLIIGTNYNSLLFMGSDTVIQVSGSDALGSNTVKSLLVENDTIIWVGTNKGLVKLTLHSAQPFSYSFSRLAVGDGLPSGEINRIVRFRDNIWLGTGRGLVSFDPEKIKENKVPPAIHIQTVSINGRDTVLLPAYDLAHDQNNIRIGFKALTFKGPENVHYRYRMIGVTDQSSFTHDTYVNLTGLKPGKYTFRVNAGNANWVWNDQPAMVNITIHKPFKQTATFIIMMVLLGTMIPSVIGLFIFWNYRKRAEMTGELVEMEQKLLRSQMNPHFIYNCMLAIQNFIYKENVSDAGRYLSSFAKLMRLILNSSRKEYIPLMDEIEYLTLYLELQKLRFDKRFDYRLSVSEDINREMTLVPPMLAQPFIENAIEHGFKTLNKKGFLLISIVKENESILFTIEDNGVGISRGREFAQKDKTSGEALGMAITVERLQLLNKQKHKKVQLHVDELSNAEGIPIGTKISFKIDLINILDT